MITADGPCLAAADVGASRGVLSILAEDRRVILYRPELGRLTGSVTSAILLSQIIYWAVRKNGRFYKFKEPPKRKQGEGDEDYQVRVRPYRIGDSWTEELGFTRKVFDQALKQIATKHRSVPPKDPSEAEQGMEALRHELQASITYHTDLNRVTWYYVDLNRFERVIERVYVTSHPAVTQSSNGALPSSENTCIDHGLSEERGKRKKYTASSLTLRKTVLPAKGEDSPADSASLHGLVEWNVPPRGHVIHSDYHRLVEELDPFLPAGIVDEVFNLLMSEQLAYWSQQKIGKRNLYKPIREFLIQRYRIVPGQNENPETFLRADVIRSQLKSAGAQGINGGKELINRLLEVDAQLRRHQLNFSTYIEWACADKDIHWHEILDSSALENYLDSDAAERASIANLGDLSAQYGAVNQQISHMESGIRDKEARTKYGKQTGRILQQMFRSELTPDQAVRECREILNKLRAKQKGKFFVPRSK